MTIYDLTEALKRYWKPIAVAFAVLIFLVVTMTFTIEDGKPKFRSALKYDSSVQIAVVDPGTESLISSGEGTADLAGAAGLYASLLTSSEAAEWIGDQNGYTLESAVKANTDRSSIITARVTGPSAEQATGAALSTFVWLNKRLLEPVETANFPSPPAPTPIVVLDSAFSSFTHVDIDAGLAGVDEDLFLFVDTGGQNSLSVPLQRSAATTVSARTTLEPLTTVVLTIATSDDVVIDRIRLAPEPAPSVVDVLPELRIVLGDDAVRSQPVEEDAAPVWAFDAEEISLSWIEGTVPVQAEPLDANTVDVDLALLTPAPGYTTSGGRRGPILAISALLIGSVLILASVIVGDTWSRQRDARTVTESDLVFPLEPMDNSVAMPALEESATDDVETQAASIES